MKFLKETMENEYFTPTLEESENSKEPEYFLEGIFVQTNIKNRNGRIYPKEVVAPEVERYKREFIDKKRALGTLNHPADGSPNIDLKEVSHLITSIWEDGNYYHCRAKILDTPNGRIVKAMIKEGIQLGVSTRAVGSTTRKDGIDYVNPDFRLITAGDIVFLPSSQKAYPVGLIEGLEYSYDEETGKCTLIESTDPDVSEKTNEPEITEEEKTKFQVSQFKEILESITK